MPPIGPTDGKILTIDAISQNRLHTIKKIANFKITFKESVTPSGLPRETKFQVIASPIQRHFKI